MQKTFITQSKEETHALGKTLAGEIKNPLVICLEGELGAGKTTFVQGFLEGLGIEGPYTSPTFVIMKEYVLKKSNFKFTISNKIQKVYHLDAYRVDEKDILDLGWEEITTGENIVLVEWADRIKKIIPQDALKIHFEWLDENQRKIIFFSVIK